MGEKQTGRWVAIAVVLGLATYALLPNFLTSSASGNKEQHAGLGKALVYGLDIQGGLHLVLGVDTEQVVNDRLERLGRSLAAELREENSELVSSKASVERLGELTLNFKSDADRARARAYLDRIYGATLQVLEDVGSNIVVKYYDNVARENRKQVVQQAIEVIRNRIDEFGVSEPSIQAQGEERILVQLPGIADAERAKDLINRTAKLDFQIVSDAMEASQLEEMIAKLEAERGIQLGGEKGLKYSEYIKVLNSELKAQLPADTKVIFQKNPVAESLEAGRIPVLVRTDTDLSGDALEDAWVRPDQYNKPQVIFRFGVEGRKRFSEVTGSNVGKSMAIVLDEVVQSAPNIRERIDSDTAQIDLGRSTYQEAMAEAQLIAMTLRSGALPAKLTALEERTVGPTLGRDAIERGKLAGLLAFAMIIGFMLIYYRGLGMVASFALIVNIMLLLAVLSSLGATITLPGVAGMVLTLGMSVDANIIIFERIKEELRNGASGLAAVRDGFGNAFSAIVDSNITTIAVCVALMYYGSGPVRGFAVTLTAGIITAMFTSIFLSRTLINQLLSWCDLKVLLPIAKSTAQMQTETMKA